jgi:predicted glycoside hydrolase/deacetylase ChbG (UPF0249 family)
VSCYTGPVKRLIINADDFGLAPGVNRAIVELQQAGALSSTTLMATARSFSAAVHLAFAQPGLGVGCHVILVDGTPCLHPRDVPSLLDPQRPGQSVLRPSVGTFLGDLLRRRIEPREIEAEAVAQIQRIQSSGVTVSHIDSHKHIHMFPQTLAPLLRAAQQCGVPCVRNPFEPGWSLRATQAADMWRRFQVNALRTQYRAFKKLTKQHKIKTTDGAIGVLATGTLDEQVLRSLLAAMPEGIWELVCHPGYRDEALEQANTRLLTSRDTERDALLAVVPETLHQNPNCHLIDFHELGR